MKVLVDSSVWIDHLHSRQVVLEDLLANGAVCTHPAIIGELACGLIKNRQHFLSLLVELPRIGETSLVNTLAIVEEKCLWGRGLGWIGVQLLASALETQTLLWTKDRALAKAAQEIEVAFVAVAG